MDLSSAFDAGIPFVASPIMTDQCAASTITEVDPWDPNNWDLDKHEYRIYGDDNAQTWCVVDEVDYHWAIRWKWHINTPNPKVNGSKRYFVRSTSNGRRWGPKLYLHIAILKRARRRRPSPLHIYSDHKDGNERNCRRKNLRWRTPKQNRKTARGHNKIKRKR